MSDHILIQGLRLKTRVGWSAEERATPQVVLVDLDVETDVASAGASDDLADTVDYASLLSEVAAYVEARETRLLEKLAAEIADLVAAKTGVNGVTVEVGKEIPPVPEEVAKVAVRVERRG